MVNTIMTMGREALEITSAIITITIVITVLMLVMVTAKLVVKVS